MGLGGIDPAQLAGLFNEYLSSNNTLNMPYEKCDTVPRYGSDGAAGIDVAITDAAVILPQRSLLFNTALKLAIPPGHFGFMKERSSIGNRECFILGGIIDCDYRGVIKARLFNAGSTPQTFCYGDRVANLIIIPYKRGNMIGMTQLDSTARGTAGYGSTGK